MNRANKLFRILKYSVVGGAVVSGYLSLQNSQFEVGSIGIVRLSRAASTVVAISYNYQRKLYGSGLEKDTSEYSEIKSLCHTYAAQKLLDLCCTNKGVYIKVGQHIAALDYILPQEFVTTMRVLHSRAPSNDIKDVYKVIKEDLKKEASELFETFDEEPLGTASLAQVHKATLKDGNVVAVKVQHPYVQGNSYVDLKTMEVLVKLVSWLFPEFKFQWLVNETKRNIPIELNFQQEGHNAEKIAKLLNYFDWLYIPKVKWELSTPRVLTMEYVDGGQVNDLQYIKEHKIDPFEVSEKLGHMYSHMIYIHGFVHSDPHPGNILLKSTDNGDCKIILLDHGLYAELTNEFKVEYANLWLSILDRDRKKMREHSKNLGIEGNFYGLFTCMITGRSWDSILEGINKKRPTKSEKDLFQKEIPNVLPSISGILDRVNRQMLLILKTNDLLRGIEHTLKTNYKMGAFKTMTKCCVSSVYSDKIRQSNSMFSKFNWLIKEYWTLFKVNLFYSYLAMKYFSFKLIGIC